MGKRCATNDVTIDQRRTINLLLSSTRNATISEESFQCPSAAFDGKSSFTFDSNEDGYLINLWSNLT